MLTLHLNPNAHGPPSISPLPGLVPIGQHLAMPIEDDPIPPDVAEIAHHVATITAPLVDDIINNVPDHPSFANDPKQSTTNPDALHHLIVPNLLHAPCTPTANLSMHFRRLLPKVLGHIHPASLLLRALHIINLRTRMMMTAGASGQTPQQNLLLPRLHLTPPGSVRERRWRVQRTFLSMPQLLHGRPTA